VYQRSAGRTSPSNPAAMMSASMPILSGCRRRGATAKHCGQPRASARIIQSALLRVWSLF
jgi:hypothetical protein